MASMIFSMAEKQKQDKGPAAMYPDHLLTSYHRPKSQASKNKTTNSQVKNLYEIKCM